ncbi:MAG TPA: DNA polymerase III subunit delta' [Bacillota bacterium]|nr:DNA polymerase III subunit delta' [Bacillota bacterium]
MTTWRHFCEIQPIAGEILMNSFKKNRLSHAYLIQGGQGTGKRTLARLMAQTIFCEQKTAVEPCQTCRNCKRIKSGNFPDLHWIKRDGLSIKNEQIKQLQREFTYSSFESGRKVYVIEDAHTLTVNASNRILKFLEEPTSDHVAIILTENSQSIIPTIRSRCQMIDLKPLSQEHFQTKLRENGINPQNTRLISQLTTDLQEAFQLNEDKWFAQARKLMLQLIQVYITNPDDAFLLLHDDWLEHFQKRHEQERGLDLLIIAFKDIIYFHIDDPKSMVVFSADDPLLKRAMMTFSYERLLNILQALLHAQQQIRQNVHPTLVMEQLTLQI